MSFQEKNIVASILATLIVLAIFFPRAQGFYQSGQFDGTEGLVLLGKTGLYFVGASVVANISMIILLSILQAIISGDKQLTDLVDERDKMIERRGMQIFGGVIGLGLVSAMGALALGVAAIPVFFIILLSFAAGELVSSVAKLTMFRLGW